MGVYNIPLSVWPVIIYMCVYTHNIIIIQVIWKHFYSIFSSGDHGTLYQLRNKVNCTNVVKDPKNDYNACDDFFTLIISSHVIAATLSMLKMNSMNDTPSADVLPNSEHLWMQPDESRKAALDKICQQVVDSFVDFSFGHTSCNNDTDKVEEYAKQLLGIGLFYP